MKTHEGTAFPWVGREQEIERLHAEGLTGKAIGQRLKIDHNYVRAYFEGIVYSEGVDHPMAHLPTQEQIRERSEAIRAEWSPEQRERRRVGYQRFSSPIVKDPRR